jgi:hypothetical protein
MGPEGIVTRSRSAVSVGPVARLDQGEKPGRAGSD